jgi:hypothetical protein
MNLRVLVAAIVGAIVMFTLGYLIFHLALGTFLHSQMIPYPGLMKEPMPDMVPLALSNFAFAWLYAYIFDQWAGVSTFFGGVIAGITIAIPLAIAIDLQYLAFMNLYRSITVLFVDVAAIAVMNGITGGVMGIILGKMRVPILSSRGL